MCDKEKKITLVSNWSPINDRIKDVFLNDDKVRTYHIPNSSGIFEKLEKADPVQFKQQYLGEPWTVDEK